MLTTRLQIAGINNSHLPTEDILPTHETNQDMVALDAVLFRIAIAFAVLGTLLLLVLIITVSLNYRKYITHKRIERNFRASECTYNNPIDILTHEDLLVEEIHNRPEYGSLTASPTELTDSAVPNREQNGDALNCVPRLEFIQDTEDHDVDIDNQFSYISLEV